MGQLGELTDAACAPMMFVGLPRIKQDLCTLPEPICLYSPKSVVKLFLLERELCTPGVTNHWTGLEWTGLES